MTSLTAIDGSAGVPPEPDWELTFTDPADAARAHGDWAAVMNELKAANALTVGNGHAIKRLVIFRLICDRTADTLTAITCALPAVAASASEAYLVRIIGAAC